MQIRAGLHLGVTTVERFFQEDGQQPVREHVGRDELITKEWARSIRTTTPIMAGVWI